MINEDKYYRVDEVAIILNCNKRTVYRIIQDPLSKLKAFKLSPGVRSSYRILGKDLSDYLQSRQAEPWS